MMSVERRLNSDSQPAKGNSLAGNSVLDLRDIVLRLDNLVREAADKVPLYQDLYEKNPRIKSLSDFQQLPITNRHTFAKLGDVSNAVRNPWEMLGPIAPWDMEQNRFPLPVLHSEHDEKKVTERLSWILEYVGLEIGEKIVFLVHPTHQYGVAELVDLLIYLGFQCQIIQVIRQSCQDLQMLLNETCAATFFVATDPELITWELPECVKTLVTFNHPKDLKGEFRYFDILHLDEIPLLAARQQSNPYTWLQDHFYLEESSNKTLIVTTLCHDFGPFIRYDTGIRARVDGVNLFLVDELT